MAIENLNVILAIVDKDMNTSELKKILGKHKIGIEYNGNSGYEENVYTIKASDKQSAKEIVQILKGYPKTRIVRSAFEDFVNYQKYSQLL